MDFDELLEARVTCEGCGLVVCQCHRVAAVSRDHAGRLAVVNFYADEKLTDRPALRVEDDPPRNNWVGWVLLSSLLFWVVCIGLITAKAMGLL